MTKRVNKKRIRYSGGVDDVKNTHRTVMKEKLIELTTPKVEHCKENTRYVLYIPTHESTIEDESMLAVENTEEIESFGKTNLDEKNTIFQNLRLTLVFDTPYVEAEVICILFPSGDLPTREVNLDLIIEHTVPSTSCKTNIRTVLSDNAKTSFTSEIIVKKGAFATKSDLSHKTLVTGEKSKNTSSPVLRIDNDDVTCSHSSTTSRVSEDEIYYLNSRGLSKSQATNVVINGFVEELLKSIENEKIRQVVSNGFGDMYD